MARPNILLITTDQQRTDTLSCLGAPVGRTPHLDALAASSAVDLSGLFAELERLVAAAAERAGAQQARPREIDLRDGAVSGERGTATDAEGPSHPTMRA